MRCAAFMDSYAIRLALLIFLAYGIRCH